MQVELQVEVHQVLQICILDYSGTSYGANIFSNIEIYIPNYASSNNKSVSVDSASENTSSTNYIGFWAGYWAQTSAITGISLKGSLAFIPNSTAYLYGIKNS